MRKFLGRHRGLLNYTALNYLDKLLTFAVPLLVLYLLKDRTLYNEIEYIYSIAAIASIVIELGVRNYFLYAYKESNERDQLVIKVRGCYLLQFTIYGALAAVALFFHALSNSGIHIVFMAIMVRALFVYFVSFFTIYYRLIDRPSMVFTFSITTNLITVFVILLFSRFTFSMPLIYFFISQIVLVSGTILYRFLNRQKVSISTLWNYLKEALIFAWPIILNLFLFMFVSNYGKVYARNYLSEDQMFQISFVQRIALIIQLAHASAVGYLSKRIFVEKGNAISYKILAVYSVLMLGSMIGVFALLEGMRILEIGQTVPIDLVTILIVIYTLAWCYGAYFEMYINKMNKNRYILLFSGISSLVFVAVVNLAPMAPLARISLGMAISMIISLCLILGFVLKKGNGSFEKDLAADSGDITL